MATRLKDFNTAARLHAIVSNIVRNYVDKYRPVARYGVVVGDVNTATMKVNVRIGNDSSTMPAVCSPFFTPAAGSYVRLEGTDDDLFVISVLSGSLNNTGSSIPPDVTGMDAGSSVSATSSAIEDGGGSAGSNVGLTAFVDGGSSA